MAFDRDAILAQIEQDKDRFLKLVNGTTEETVVLETRTVKTVQGQLDEAIGIQIAEADSILAQTQDLRDATAVDTAAAQSARDTAESWASADPGVEVTPGNESAYSYSVDSAASAAASLASQNAAGVSEANAATSETNAATSAGNAATSETNAAGSAAAALASEQDAEAAWDAFREQYWGAFASEPALSPLGNAATAGDMYLNTGDGFLYAYDGVQWAAITSFVPRTAATGSAQLPVGTEAQRDASPNPGYIRFNSDIGLFEGFNGTVWTPVGAGATGGSGDQVFVENDQAVSASYTIPSGRNASSVGPITIADGATVTISDGSRWLVH